MKKREDGSRVIKIGPVEMGLIPFSVFIAGAVLAIFIIKTGFDITIGEWSCNSKPAEVKVTIDKSKVEK